MFTHLLVTLDGTRHAESVLPYAINLAKRLSAEITVIRVATPTLGATSERGAIGKRPAANARASASVAEAEAYLQNIAANNGAFGVAISTDVREGDAATEILRAASELGVDAIALSTHSRRGLDRLMFGSVAEQVVHGTSLPVILLRSKA